MATHDEGRQHAKKTAARQEPSGPLVADNGRGYACRCMSKMRRRINKLLLKKEMRE